MFGIQAGIIMPWDEAFDLLAEDEKYLDDLFINRNVTKTEENSSTSTSDSDEGVIVLPPDPIWGKDQDKNNAQANNGKGDNDDSIIEVKIGGISIDFGQDILDILGYTGPDLGFSSTTNTVVEPPAPSLDDSDEMEQAKEFEELPELIIDEEIPKEDVVIKEEDEGVLGGSIQPVEIVPMFEDFSPAGELQIRFMPPDADVPDTWAALWDETKKS